MTTKRADSAQLALVDVAEPAAPARRPGRRATGRHERALDKAVKESADLRRPVMAAAVSAARSTAWALDTAEAKSNAYAVAQLVKPYQDLLAALGLMPQAATDPQGADPFGDLDGPQP